LDTARHFGAAEQLLGEALRQRANREDVIIATKGGLRMDGDRLVREASSEWLRKGRRVQPAAPRNRSPRHLPH
jgi:aryl-alcohol dehydrogenase-like predicted oxidoreductase